MDMAKRMRLESLGGAHVTILVKGCQDGFVNVGRDKFEEQVEIVSSSFSMMIRW